MENYRSEMENYRAILLRMESVKMILWKKKIWDDNLWRKVLPDELVQEIDAILFGEHVRPEGRKSDWGPLLSVLPLLIEISIYDRKKWRR